MSNPNAIDLGGGSSGGGENIPPVIDGNDNGSSSGSSGSGDGGTGLEFDIVMDQFKAKSLRYNAQLNIMRPWNNRYRGNREAFKFNVMMQRVMQASASLTILLRTWNEAVRLAESSVLFTDTEIALVYHIGEQLRFKEYLILRDSDKRWFV